MNENRRKMLALLEELRDECGCVAIKAEFEAEGSRTDELIMLCDVVRRARIPLTLKIGGCEAARDMHQAKLFGADSIMAPMVETPYAMHKFKATARKIYGSDIDDVDWVINAETKTCHENLDEILDEGRGFLKSVCIGRSDYSGSLGLSDRINGPEMLERVIDIARRSKERGFHVTFGGKVLPEAIPFVQAMVPYADAFETRKVTFAMTDDPERIQHAIDTAMCFEILYLRAKRAFYDEMASEDVARLKKFEGSCC